MLLLFAFSITPKIALHTIFANHKDAPATAGKGETKQLYPSGFRCDCDNLVVESPFVYAGSTIQLVVPFSFVLRQDAIADHFYASDNFVFGLRGPPLTA